MKTESILLIEEELLTVRPTLARLLGINQALILQQIQYWLTINKKKKAEMKEGRYWTYNTYQEWGKQFTWLGEESIKYYINDLEKKGVLLSRKFKSKDWDQTKSYSIDYDQLENLYSQSGNSYPTDEGLSTPSSGEILPVLNRNTETTPETPAETTTSASEEKSRIVAALQRSSPPLDHSGLNVLDVSKYPEDIKPVIIKVCQLWNLRPPNGTTKALWIKDSRALLDACGEFGPGLLDKIRADYVDYMEKHQGIPPFTIAGPGSLEKTARAAAGLKRSGESIQPDSENINPDDYWDRERNRSRR